MKLENVDLECEQGVFIAEIKTNKLFASDVFYYVSFVNNILGKGYSYILESKKFYFDKNNIENSNKSVGEILKFAGADKEKILYGIAHKNLKDKDKGKYLNVEKLFFKEDFDSLDSNLINFCLSSLKFKDEYIKYMEFNLGVFIDFREESEKKQNGKDVLFNHTELTDNLVRIRNLTKHGSNGGSFEFWKFLYFLGVVLPDKIFNEFKDKILKIYSDKSLQNNIKELFKEILKEKKVKIKELYEKKYSKEELRKSKDLFSNRMKENREKNKNLDKKSIEYKKNKEEQDKNINQFESVKKDILELFPNKQNYIDYKTTIKEQNAKQEKSKKGKVFKPPVWFESKMKQEEYYRKCYREKIHKYYLSLEKNRSQTELDKILEDVVIHKYNNHKFRNEYFLIGENFIKQFNTKVFYKLMGKNLDANAFEDYRRMFYLTKKIDGLIFKYLNTYKDDLNDGLIDLNKKCEYEFKADTKLRKIFDCLSHGGNFFSVLDKDYSLQDFFNELMEFFVKIAKKYNAKMENDDSNIDSINFKNSKVLFSDFKHTLIGLLGTAKYLDVFNISGAIPNNDGICAGTLEKNKKANGFIRKNKIETVGNLNYIMIKYETNAIIDSLYKIVIHLKYNKKME